MSPVQLAAAIGSLVNGGMLRPATLLRHEAGTPIAGEQVISPETSDKMRTLMRLVVAKGTGRKAAAKGYYVGGKTGTAEKQFGGRYNKSAKISSFVGAFPIQDPRYVVFAMVDEPIGNKRTFNYATGGWVAAPIVGRVVSQIGPLLGIEPLMTGVELLALPMIDDERRKQKKSYGLVKNASVASGVVRPAGGLKKPPSISAETPKTPVRQKTKAETPPKDLKDETPNDRIARKTREALEQAFAAQ